MVQNIKIGDKLMGPDGLSRNVLGTTTGVGQLYKINPNSGGESFVCNDVHVLSLKVNKTQYRYIKGDIVNIPVNEYLNKSNNFKKMTSLWRASLDFAPQELVIPPYILGLWLGDGNSDRSSETSMDSELSKCWSDWGKENNCHTKTHTSNSKASTYSLNHSNARAGSKKNEFVNTCNAKLRDLGLLNNKHIPDIYLKSSREQRLALLAGIIDTDGHYSSKTSFDVLQKNKTLADQICYLARSLGFKVSKKIVYKGIKKIDFVGEYVRLDIRGKISQIPTKLKRKQASDCKKNAELSGFTVEDLGIGNYYGFELGGDHLFLLGDFTVTHNTTFMMTLVRHMVFQKRHTLFMIHEGDAKNIRKRVLCAYMGINQSTLYDMLGSKHGVELINVAGKDIDKYLQFVPYIKAGGMYCEDVIDLVKELNQERISKHGTGFDVFINDYPKKLKMKATAGSKNEIYRASLADVYDQFNFLASELDLHCFVAIQVNREGAKDNSGKNDSKTLLAMENVDESYGITQNMANIISLNRGPDDKRLNICRLNITKSRNGETDIVVNTRTNYTCGLVYGDKENFDFGKAWKLDINHLTSRVQPDNKRYDAQVILETLDRIDKGELVDLNGVKIV